MIFNDCPWWHFWNPRSGAVGGIMMALFGGMLSGILHSWVFMLLTWIYALLANLIVLTQRR
jgi:high-affinity Fe2+/Pb2+ permease